jgi:hypothetical protein
MKIVLAIGFLLAWVCGAQEKRPVADQSKSVTVRATIDHNRTVIEAEIPLADGSRQKVQVWVDNGNPNLELSRALATSLKLRVSCDDKACSAPPPAAMTIGGMTIALDEIKEAHIPLKPVSGSAVLAPGLRADINLPSSVLRHFDVLLDFPGRKFSIGAPGSIHFRGESGKVQIGAMNGLIQTPVQIEKKKYNLALDLGSSISFLSEDVYGKLASSHPDWPHMTGAVGSASMWGAEEETQWRVMRLERLQYGPLFLTSIPVVSLPKATGDFFEKRAGMPTIGSLAAQALLNYRVGLDYAHSMVYFDIGRTFKFPDFDVVGLILRPEDDGEFTILGVADFNGKPSIDGLQASDHLLAVDNIPLRGVSLGQVWSMLGGTPGQERRLTIERAGKQFAVMATVERFLNDSGSDAEKK